MGLKITLKSSRQTFFCSMRDPKTLVKLLCVFSWHWKKLEINEKLEILNYSQIIFKIKATLLAYLFLVLSHIFICQISVEVEETSFEMKVAFAPSSKVPKILVKLEELFCIEDIVKFEWYWNKAGSSSTCSVARSLSKLPINWLK